MNRKIATFAAGLPLTLIVILAVTGFQSAQTNTNSVPVAWVNTQVILQQTPGYAEAESTFAGEMRVYQAEITQLQTQFDSLVSDFDRTSLILTPSARDQKEQELRELQQQNQARVQTLSQQAQRRERELVGPIEERVSAVIEGVRAERDIGVIFDVSASAGFIVAADRTLDLTPTIVQRLGSQ